MNLYIYSDESGVFDVKHNDFFLFGGIICFGSNQKNKLERMYNHVENCLRQNKKKYKNPNYELKASHITNSEKGKFYRSLNNTYKFCVVVKQKQLLKEVFENKRHKQRYMDFAYKMVLKKCLKTLIDNEILDPNQIEHVFVKVDEHQTATDGKYELRENLLNEFKNGMFNLGYECYFDPIFPKLYDVHLDFCNSSKTTLVRCADIVVNHCYHNVLNNKGYIRDENNLFVYYLPSKRIGYTGLEYFKEIKIWNK